MKKTAPVLILKSIEKFSTRIGHGKIVEPDHQAWTSNVPQWCQAVLLSLLDQSSHNHSFALKTQYVGKDYARGPEYCCCCQQWRIPIEKRKKEKWIRTWRKARYQIPTWEVVVCNTELPELDETAGNETSVSWSCNLATFSFNSCRWWATSFFKCEAKSWRDGLWAISNKATKAFFPVFKSKELPYCASGLSVETRDGHMGTHQLMTFLFASFQL